MRREAVFIGHDASRTGAPTVLLRNLRWLRANTDLDFIVGMREGGALETDFRAISRTLVTNDVGTALAPKVERGLESMGLARSRRAIRGIRLGRRMAELRDADVIYVNSVSAGGLLPDLVGRQRSVITHVHELEFALQNLVSPEDLAAVIRHTDRYVVVSEAVKENLVANHAIDPGVVEVIPNGVATPATTAGWLESNRAAFRAECRIADDALVVGCVGRMHWIKGPDIFVQVARRVIGSTDLPVVFVWLGIDRADPSVAMVEHDLAALGLTDKVRLLDPRADALPFLAALDVLLITSREETSSLVALEAGSVGRPTIAFDLPGLRGTLSDSTAVVPYLDTDAMAAELVVLLEDETLRRERGDIAMAQVGMANTLSATAGAVFSVIRGLA